MLGLHFGTDIGASYVGGFGAFVMFDGYDHERPMSGTMAGIEVIHPIRPNIDLTGQLGWAELLGVPGGASSIAPAS